MNESLESLSLIQGALTQALLHSGVMVALLVLLRTLLRDRIPARVYALGWLLVMLRLILPAVPGTPLSVYALGDSLAAAPAEALAPILPATGSTAEATSPAGASAAAASNESWPLWLLPTALLGLWLIGAVAVLGLTLRRYRALAQMTRSGQPLDGTRLDRLAEECRKNNGLRRRVPLVAVEGIGLPAVVGCLRPKLLVSPQQVEMLTEFQWRCVLLHEMAHLRRRDLWAGALVALVQTVHWFNPFAWLAAHFWQQDRELAADALALSVLGPEQHRAFGSTLIEVLDSNRLHQAATPSAAFLPCSWGGLRRRIGVLARPRGESRAITALATLGVAMLAMVTMTDCIETGHSDGVEPIAMTEELAPGVAHFDAERIDEAASFFDQQAIDLPDEDLRYDASVLARRTRAFETIANEATDQLKARNFDEAIPAYERAVEVARTINPQSPVIDEIEERRLAPAMVLQGNQRLRQGDPVEAGAAFRQALEIRPGYAPARSGLQRLRRKAKILYYEGYLAEHSDPDTARKKWRQVIEVTDADDEWHIKAAKRLGEQNHQGRPRVDAQPEREPDEAAIEATIAAAPDRATSEDTRKLYYEAYVAKYSNRNMAREKWQRLVGMTEPENEWHRKSLKRLAELDGSPASNRELAPTSGSSEFDTAARSDDDAPAVPGDRKKARALFVEAVKLHQQGELEPAIARYQEALEADGTFAYALRGMGIAYASLGDAKAACQAYRDYLELSPRAIDAAQVRTILQKCKD